MTGRLPAAGRTVLAWNQVRVTGSGRGPGVTSTAWSPSTLGINYPWINADGSESVNWLTAAYSSATVAADLAVLQGWGITKIRAWAQLESVMDWSGSAYSLDATYSPNLDDFLTRCASYGISVILVIGDGSSSGGYSNLDGKFRWTFVTGSSTAYLNGLTAYVNHYASHPNILMWELQNEPYGNLTWSANAEASGATQAQTHTFLVAAYETVKALAGSTYVGFSDYEEEQQPVYQIFSSSTNRANLVNDCTDVYSMHIYRANSGQIADFRQLTAKPKWCTEIGCYNYYDPTASTHPIAAWDELLDDSGPNGFSGLCNPPSVRDIGVKLMNSGFSLIMPWAFGDNAGMVLHTAAGGYVTGTLPAWMTGQFSAGRSAASGRHQV